MVIRHLILVQKYTLIYLMLWPAQFVCVFVCMHACVRACVHVFIWVTQNKRLQRPGPRSHGSPNPKHRLYF